MRRVDFLIHDGFPIIVLATMAPFEIANDLAGGEAYALRLCSVAGGAVRSTVGATVMTEPVGDARSDTLVVVGPGRFDAPPPALIAHLVRTATTTRRIAAPCTGAFLLAEAGLLDGRRATTHWAHAGELARRYPAVTVDADRIFIADGSVWTSAGMSAGIDLAIALIEDDLGPAIAKAVARLLVVYQRRPGGQSQFSALLEMEPRSDRIRRALSHARENLAAPLAVDDLAAVANLSPRQFSRIFRAETGRSPAKAVEQLRLEAARLMLEDGRHSLDIVARTTGFADRLRMRRAFQRAYGQPPQAIQRVARLAAGGLPASARRDGMTLDKR